MNGPGAALPAAAAEKIKFPDDKSRQISPNVRTFVQ